MSIIGATGQRADADVYRDTATSEEAANAATKLAEYLKTKSDKTEDDVLAAWTKMQKTIEKMKTAWTDLFNSRQTAADKNTDFWMGRNSTKREN